MIDIHCHILPRLDDGPQTEQDSLEMARAAVEEGIDTIIATPHHNSIFRNNRESVLTHVSIFNELLEQEGIPLTVLAGQETELNGDMLTDIENGKLLPLNDTKFIFVEFPRDHVPQYAKQMLFDIQVAGFMPIIVHPERNEGLLNNPNRLYDLVKTGAYTQITAGSIIGKFGKTVRKFTHQIIDAHLTHFIASDAHNTTSRKFWMREALDEVEKVYGQELYYMFIQNSHLLVDGMHVNRMEPFKVRKKKFLGIF